MVKRKSVLSGSVVGAIVFIILLPFDEFLIAMIFTKGVLGLGWIESIIIGIIVGIIVFAIVELHGE